MRRSSPVVLTASLLFFLFSNSHPLYKPCKCSGSIGLTHQDCLQSWLEVQRGDGKCELCKTRFQFAPQYAEGAPEKLPAAEVLYGLSRRCISRWLPFLLRILFAAALWLVVAPLGTSYLYQAWMHKPSFIADRVEWSLFLTDLVSGLVVIACIILSFLSLISFADFLREEWQQNGLVQGGERRRHHHDRAGEDEPRRFPVREQDVDNWLWQNVQQEILAQPAPLRAGLAGMSENDDAMHLDNQEDNEANEPVEQNSINNDDDPYDDDDDDDSYSEDEDEELPDEDIPSDEDDDGDEWMPIGPEEIDNQPPPRRNMRPAPRNNPPPPPFDNEADDPVDVGINIALDEILGVRGPLSTVVQNLMWLFAFNTAYLGFFTFAPRVIGTSILSMFFNMSTPVEGDGNSTFVFNATEMMSLTGVFHAIENESAQLNTAFRLRDVVTIIVGYLSSAFVTILIRGLWVWSRSLRFLNTGRPARNNDAEEMRAAFDDMHRFAQAFGHENGQMDDPQVVAIGVAIGVALDAVMAVIKVGLLLFMKMFLLPIVLGVALDLSTVDLLGGTIEDRVTYAGKDLFSSLLLHWVAGITFMLLVTVSVLQLREVMHPDLLAQIIRPQEPQPDLLGNLLHETAATHAKRMLLSLVIYSFLLYLQIHFPVNFILSTGLSNVVSFFKLKFCYILMPQFQVPLELLIFHLCMLALLERNKNSIGELQHHWLKFLSKQLGLADAMLPRHVDDFRLVGSRAVFVEDRSIEDFWYRLSEEEKESDGERFIDEHLESFRAPLAVSFNPGESKANGERVLRFGSDFIRLPKRLPGRVNRSRSVLLPTKFGRYRLKRDLFNNTDPVIQLWEEVPGTIISRPPEGWDDLGAGGADVQGRWAWGREKRSNIERGVAHRVKLFYPKQGVFSIMLVFTKVVSVVLLSWFATTFFLVAVLGGPLAIGRLLYLAFRVPQEWIHDPLGFAVGSLIFFPLAKRCTIFVYTSETSLIDMVLSWGRRFRYPPVGKSSVLLAASGIWSIVSALLLGFVYELAFLKDSRWFMGEEPLVENWSACWVFGFLLLNLWGYCCATGLLTRRFWAAIFEDRGVAWGADVVAAEANERAAAWVDVGDGLRLRWQGKHGRVANFYNTLWRVLYHWEWDKVDAAVLLSQCALPVTFELACITFAPQACLILCIWRFPGLSGLARLVIFRSLMCVGCAIEILRSFRDELSSWFDAAHKTARDDRYLIGRVLLNYDEVA